MPGYLQRLPDVRCEADSVAEGRAGGFAGTRTSQLPLPPDNPMEESSEVKKGPQGHSCIWKQPPLCLIDAGLLGPLLHPTSLV